MTTNTTPEGIDLDKLEALARAATPGPWLHRRDRGNKGAQHCLKLQGEQGPWIADCIDNADSSKQGGIAGECNARFIAAANPAAVQELISLARAALAHGASSAPVVTEITDASARQLIDFIYERVGFTDLDALISEVQRIVIGCMNASYAAGVRDAKATPASAQPVAAAPAGWRLVPVEPWRLQVAAVNDPDEKLGSVAEIYRRMVAAAPVCTAISLNDEGASLLRKLADAADTVINGGSAPVGPLIDKVRAYLAAAPAAPVAQGAQVQEQRKSAGDAGAAQDKQEGA